MPERVLYEDHEFSVVENQNYPIGQGNLFLEYFRGDYSKHQCVGGADFNRRVGKWEVTVSSFYDEEKDSDAQLIGVFDTQEEAAKCLWENRNKTPLDTRRGGSKP
jgi:hypothetical protein